VLAATPGGVRGGTRSPEESPVSPLTLVPPRAYRWNYAVMGLDISLFVLALSFASTYGILPLFVSHLADSNLAVGAIPALRAAALLPPIFVAGLIERLRRKKPFVVWVTLIERLPYLALAIATPLLATTRPMALLWLLYALIALTIFAAGVATPAWIDLLARMLPADWRGRFFGLSSAVGGLLGVAGSAGAAFLLARYDWVVGVALCFAAAFACLMLSFGFILLGREPVAEEATTAPRATATWRRLPGVVRGDRNLRRYLAALVLITAAGTTAAFYIVDAKQALGLSDGAAGLYATALLAASTAGSLLWGYVGDHAGHKRVILGGALCTGLAPLAALAARDPRWGPLVYGLAFLLAGLATSGLQLAALTFIVDLAPADQRPTYIGLANVVQAPAAFAAPLLGAALADARGYPPLFALTALTALIGAAVLARFVRDPRIGEAGRIARAAVNEA
jgi:MFS family permease